MKVVCNTSPLTNLAAVGQFELLSQLFSELHIAEGVWLELNAEGRHWPGRREVAEANWIRRHRARSGALIAALMHDLDRGEAETIALAVRLEADLILLDEKEGRRMAQWLGFRVLGVVGILIEAKAAGLTNSVRPHLDALRQKAGFYISDSLYRRALAQANEKTG